MISIICILGKNKAIGSHNKLIWDIPPDMQRFREITFGHPVVMGRVTYETIGRPLPGRTNIIVTHDQNFRAPRCLIAHSLKDALKMAKKINREEIFVIGGGQIYKETMPAADKLYLTIVNDEPSADTFFPDYPEFSKIVKEEDHEYHGIRYKYLELIK